MTGVQTCALPIFRHNYDCNVIAVEASPHLASALRRQASSDITVMHYAVSDDNGLVSFYLHPNDEASSMYGGAHGARQTVMVQSITLEMLLDELHLDHVELLKMDIEGAEVPVLKATPDHVLRRFDQITVEFHNLSGIYGVEEVHRVVQRMKHAGFIGLRFDGLWSGSPHPDRDDHLNWLFLRRGAPGMHFLRVFYVRFPIRWMRWLLQWHRRRQWRRRVNVATRS